MESIAGYMQHCRYYWGLSVPIYLILSEQGHGHSDEEEEEDFEYSFGIDRRYVE